MSTHIERNIAQRLLWEKNGLDSIQEIGESICEMMRLDPGTKITVMLANGNRVEGRWNAGIPGAERIYVRADGSVAGRSELFTGDQWDRRIAEAVAKMQEEGRI